MLDVRCSMFIRFPALKQFSALLNFVFCLLTSLAHVLGDKALSMDNIVPDSQGSGVYPMIVSSLPSISWRILSSLI